MLQALQVGNTKKSFYMQKTDQSLLQKKVTRTVESKARPGIREELAMPAVQVEITRKVYGTAKNYCEI